MDKIKRIGVLGSTGSIGTQTLEIVRNNKDLQVTALAAGTSVTLMEQQIREFLPQLAVMWTEEAARDLKERVADLPVKVLCGMDGLLTLAAMEDMDILVTAIVGMIGIRPTIAAISAGKTIALANKETLVTAGHIIMPLAAEKKGSDPAGRQRAQCNLPVHERRKQKACQQDPADSLRWTLPRKEERRACRYYGRGCLKAP